MAVLAAFNEALIVPDESRLSEASEKKLYMKL